MGLREFLDGELTYILPAPGGALLTGRATTDDDADAYLASIAAMIKRREMTREEIVDTLLMKMHQIENQEHFGIEKDLLIIERLKTWVKEFWN